MIEIISAEKGITVGRFYFKNPITNLENGNIKGTTA